MVSGRPVSGSWAVGSLGIAKANDAVKTKVRDIGDRSMVTFGYSLLRLMEGPRDQNTAEMTAKGV